MLASKVTFFPQLRGTLTNARSPRLDHPYEGASEMLASITSPRVNERWVDEVSNRKNCKSMILSPYMRRSPKVTEADLQHSTILLANLWVEKGSGLASEGCVY
jgi:hypothetical protein